MVTDIWLQYGSDLSALEEGLAFVRSVTDLPVVGSCFLPSKQLLARMKFRPWNGVYLSSEYLDDVSVATKITEVRGVESSPSPSPNPSIHALVTVRFQMLLVDAPSRTFVASISGIVSSHSSKLQSPSPETSMPWSRCWLLVSKSLLSLFLRHLLSLIEVVAPLVVVQRHQR